jgi:biopolymer transport protein ExbB
MNATKMCAASAVAFLALAGNAMAQGGQPGISISKMIVDSGFVGWVLVLLSVVALALVIEAYVSLKRDKLAPPELIDEVQALFDESQYQEAMELCEDQPTFFTKICAAGIAKVGHDYEVMVKAMEEMGDEQTIRLHQKIGYIALCANVAPMLGLLGTVWGMIVSFQMIAASQGQATPAELAFGISQALLTTLFGLMVAIPSTAAFIYLRNGVVRSTIEVGAIIEDLFERFRPKQAGAR